MEEIGRAMNDGNYFGETNGSIWEITARRTEDKKSGESSGLFIDSAC